MPWQTWDLVRGGMLHVAMWCSSVIAHRATTVAHQPVSAIKLHHHVTAVMPLHHGIVVMPHHHVTAAMQPLPGIKPGEVPLQEGGDKKILYLKTK